MQITTGSRLGPYEIVSRIGAGGMGEVWRARIPGEWNDSILSELFRVAADIGGFEALPDGQSFLISDETPGPTDSLFHVIVGFPFP